MKIAVIGLKGLPAFGGAAAVGENIINELKGEYDFTVYATSSHTSLKTGYYNGFKQIVFRKLPFKKLNTLYYYILSAFHALFFGKYDLIHLHHRDAAFIIPLLRLRYKVVVTTHNSFVVTDKWKKYEWFFHLNERYFIRFANLVTCVSKNEVRKFKDKLNFDVNYIPNGIKKVSISSLPDIQYENYILFSAGRIIRTKGLSVLLNALHMINYRGKLLVAGDLDQDKDYGIEIQALSVGLDVVFLGLIRDKDLLLSFIRRSMFFVYPSSMEAMAMMLLEAASVQTPIICSNIVENQDMFSEDEVLFFNTDSVYDLGLKLEWAFNNLDLMKEKALKALKKCDSSFSWSEIALGYSFFYRSILK